MALNDNLKEILTSHTPDRLASMLLMERVPHLFDDDWQAFRNWRAELATLIDVDPCDIYFTGSSAAGVSLNPYKNFKDFSSGSDIDLAIISPHHFDISWRFIRSIRRRMVDDQLWSIILDHKNNYIYWGCIAADKIIAHLPFGTDWMSAFAKLSERPLTRDREIRARIYRDASSLRSYQASNFRKLKASLL